MTDTTIFTQLEKDHDKHRELLNRIESATDNNDERKQLFESFRTEVTAHAAAEEETLYSTMLAKPELRHDGQHSVAEHHELDELMAEIADLDPSSPEWMEKFKKLKHDYLHHIDEEEQDMFPAAEEGLTKEKEVELAKKFEERKPAEYQRALEGVDMEDDRE
ncbi:hemerythrin domain-containing protein [Sphingomicrobium marinum]|uniref:hemerythrin domain-containing protein n=1 Tax=Sphingomicrobium marinum TaxID=1227950 RepID=UPI00223F045D|nr:hemerythrin domain-containing protein [Sphingomicrobium marinum]